ncbi:DUF3775 domain-containing protein [Amorphus orientalis]|uniref:DUF3775 domain-containing protein n=1 Tax=Amorphus orientalis TaxID=649198 RepID=A0AAE4ASK8_9HYPH|nr:DUF3775 domain-containing protein [Amorphus orientalis]MDQ0314069.1 hypothetical protein [Amorphus orientalis]
MAVELTISPDTIRSLVEKARTISAEVTDTYTDGGEHDTEFDPDTLERSHAHDGLEEEEEGNLTEEELKELIDDLNVDEAADLVAVTWIGRGDFEAAEFDQARTEAMERAEGSTSHYLMSMPLLADHLEAGLDALEL